MSGFDNYPALKALERIDARAQALQEAAIDARESVRMLIDALWVATEHNALHFGESHNTVIQGRAALKGLTK